MGIFGGQRSNSVAGRARVVVGSTKLLERPEHTKMWETDFRAGARNLTSITLVAISASDGGAVSPEPSQGESELRNWLRVVLTEAGSESELAARLPPVIEVPVSIDAQTRQIVGVDFDGAERELRSYERLATARWKRTDGPIANAYAIAGLPRTIVREAKDLRDDIKGIGRSGS